MVLPSHLLSLTVCFFVGATFAKQWLSINEALGMTLMNERV